MHGKTTGGPWVGQEKDWHINVKELMAAFFTLKSFCENQRNTHIRLNLDNSTSVAYINNQGGKKPQLNSIARDIWLWAQSKGIWLSAVHIPGDLNTSADRASRAKYATESEWHLNTKIFEMIQNKWVHLT